MDTSCPLVLSARPLVHRWPPVVRAP